MLNFLSLKSTKIHIGRLTRNVNKDHLQVLNFKSSHISISLIGKLCKTVVLQEIFATFGEIKEIEFGSERQRPWLNKGFAYIEYKTHTDALNAMKHMDGGQIDGQVL